MHPLQGLGVLRSDRPQVGGPAVAQNDVRIPVLWVVPAGVGRHGLSLVPPLRLPSSDETSSQWPRLSATTRLAEPAPS